MSAGVSLLPTLVSFIGTICSPLYSFLPSISNINLWSSADSSLFGGRLSSDSIWKRWRFSLCSCPICQSTFSSSVSTIRGGTLRALCVWTSRHTIEKRPSINVSLVELPGRVPSILMNTSIDELPVHVTNPENLRSRTFWWSSLPNMSRRSALAVAR